MSHGLWKWDVKLPEEHLVPSQSRKPFLRKSVFCCILPVPRAGQFFSGLLPLSHLGLCSWHLA